MTVINLKTELVQPRLVELPNGMIVRAHGDATDEELKRGRYAGGRRSAPLPVEQQCMRLKP
jgi:hypothetical protein